MKGIYDILHQSSFPVYPKDIASSVPKPDDVTECKGCKAHARRDDARHNRKIGVCKFPNDASKHWDCSACSRFAPSTDKRHTKIVGECQWADAPTRASSSRVIVLDPVEEEPEQQQPPSTSLGQWQPVTDPE